MTVGVITYILLVIVMSSSELTEIPLLEMGLSPCPALDPSTFMSSDLQNRCPGSGQPSTLSQGERQTLKSPRVIHCALENR